MLRFNRGVTCSLAAQAACRWLDIRGCGLTSLRLSAATALARMPALRQVAMDGWDTIRSRLAEWSAGDADGLNRVRRRRRLAPLEVVQDLEFMEELCAVRAARPAAVRLGVTGQHRPEVTMGRAAASVKRLSRLFGRLIICVDMVHLAGLSCGRVCETKGFVEQAPRLNHVTRCCDRNRFQADHHILPRSFEAKMVTRKNGVKMRQ